LLFQRTHLEELAVQLHQLHELLLLLQQLILLRHHAGGERLMALPQKFSIVELLRCGRGGRGSRVSGASAGDRQAGPAV
jgi:hypothetical protein